MKVWLDLDISILLDSSELVFENEADSSKTITYLEYKFLSRVDSAKYKLKTDVKTLIEKYLKDLYINHEGFCEHESAI